MSTKRGRRLPPERIAAARECLARFMSGPAAEIELAQKFGVSTRVARRAVFAARAEMVVEAGEDRETKRADVRAAICECIAAAIARSHLRVALAGLQLLVVVDGLAEPSRLNVEHSGYLAAGAVLGKQALLDRLAELRAREN